MAVSVHLFLSIMQDKPIFFIMTSVVELEEAFYSTSLAYEDFITYCDIHNNEEILY